METPTPTDQIDQWFPAVYDIPAQVNPVQQCSIMETTAPLQGILFRSWLSLLFELNPFNIY